MCCCVTFLVSFSTMILEDDGARGEGERVYAEREREEYEERE